MEGCDLPGNRGLDELVSIVSSGLALIVRTVG